MRQTLRVQHDLDVRTVDSAAGLPAAGWDEVAGPDEAYLSAAWLRVLEGTSGASLRYLLAADGDELTGGLVTARADRAAPWLSGRPDTLLERCAREQRPGAAQVRGRLPDDLAGALLPGLVCGGRHLGRNRVITRDGADSEGTTRRLVAAAEALARSQGCRSVSFLYVDELDKTLRAVLADRGYHRYVSAAYSWLPVPAGGFTGYLNSLSGHRRRRISADRRRLRDAGVTVDLEPLAAEVIPRLAELETALLRRYGLDWSPGTSERIFTAVHRELGSAAQLSAARIGGRLTGFVLLIPHGSTWYAHRGGFDYELNAGLPVYFEVTYNRPLELAKEYGVTSIHYGTGSDATKESRGCRSTEQHAYTLPLADGARRVPRGFRVHTANVGLAGGRDDFAVIASEVPATVSAMFTRSRFAGPSVRLSRAAAADHRARGVLVLATNANVATGSAGLADAVEVRRLVADALDVPEQELLIASTGVIGRRYPMDRLRSGLAGLRWPFPGADFERAARAIMTTDTRPKLTTVAAGPATITGIAKGVGMIEPDMATLLTYFFTDADLPAEYLDRIFRDVVDRTYNALSIDTDTSTSDTAAIFANGLAGPVQPDVFAAALHTAALYLVREIARDGEGAGRVIEVRVTGARDAAQAKRVGKAIVNSPLVKTMVHGGDPNWGRVAMAIGKCADDEDID
jgi:glutamate N-acetyltransferase/amino-acid N-acetyltransferase